MTSKSTYGVSDEKEYSRRIRAWTMYDWANSAFATTILAAVLPIYYSQVAGGDTAQRCSSDGILEHRLERIHPDRGNYVTHPRNDFGCYAGKEALFNHLFGDGHCGNGATGTRRDRRLAAGFSPVRIWSHRFHRGKRFL